jgi:antitoxin component of MazEF toxin-antitoxin module
MLHTIRRRSMKCGRSLVIGIPNYVVLNLGLKAGDEFTVVYDDKKETITYLQVEPESPSVKVEVNGQVVDAVVMP